MVLILGKTRVKRMGAEEEQVDISLCLKIYPVADIAADIKEADYYTEAIEEKEIHFGKKSTPRQVESERRPLLYRLKVHHLVHRE